MKDEARARVLAEALVRVGTRAGKQVVALLTDMEGPMGLTIGNANETREAFDVLMGSGPQDVIECTLALGSEMLVLGGKASSANDARTMLLRAIASGEGVRTMERMVEAQGGDPRAVTDPARLPLAPVQHTVRATHAGHVTSVDSLAIGLAAVAMGAGRTRADQAVDHGVGIRLDAPVGAEVRPGDALATLFVRPEFDATSIERRVEGAFALGDAAPAPVALVRGRVGK